MAFFVTQFFVPFQTAIGKAGSFWFFAIILSLVMTYSIFYVPETKGKSLEQIQSFFRNESNQEDNEILVANDDDTDSIGANIEAEINAEINIARPRR